MFRIFFGLLVSGFAYVTGTSILAKSLYNQKIEYCDLQKKAETRPEDIALLKAQKLKIVEMKTKKISNKELGPAIQELQRLKELCGKVVPKNKI